MWLTIVYSALALYLLTGFFTVDFAVADVFTTALTHTILFLVSAGLFLRYRRKNYFLSFELFFFIVFFLVTYSFPLMAFNEDDLLLLVDISPYLVNKALYLSTLGFMSYLIGASVFSKPYREELKTTTYDLESIDFVKLAYIFNRIGFLLMIFFFIIDGPTLVVRYNNETMEVSGGYVLPYVRVILIISTLFELSRLAKMGIHSFKETLLNISVFYLLNISLLLLFFLVTGYRSEFLVLALTLVVAYSVLIQPVPKVVLFSGVFIGFWVMALMKFFRGFNDVDVGELQSDGAFTMIGLLSEFYIPSSTLYEFIQYVEVNGPTYGTNTMLHILSFVPYLQSVVVRLFGLEVTSPEFLTSSEFISDYILGADRSWGLGTHVIGDLYYSFGLPGVIVLMLLMGMVVSLLTERMIYRKQFSMVLILIFIVLTAQSFFFSRVEFFRPVRDLGLIFWIVMITKYTLGFRKKNAASLNPDES
jgi:oligosaccharide repeat unit polymerase